MAVLAAFVGGWGHAEPLLPLIRLTIDHERTAPDVVVCDEMDAGAVIAAEVADVPCITVSVLAARRLMSHAVVGPAWDRLRADFGLAPDPLGARLGGAVRITPAPAAFRDPNVTSPFELHHVRPPILDQIGTRPAGSRRVYATIGTVFDVESGDLFHRLVDALSMLDAPSVLTSGSHVSRSELPPVPAHVRIEPFVPQRDVLGDCAAVICHGGTGTVIAALSLGIPVVLLPMGADQPDNADRCADVGVGIVLDAVRSDSADIAEATHTVLTDGRFTRSATRLADQAAAQPNVADVREVLDLLAR